MSIGPKVTGLILSGGKGTRMAGLDKGLVSFLGRPLISHVIDRIKPQVDQLWINCNRSHDEYLKLGCPLLSDAEADYQGPLEGMLSIASQLNKHSPVHLKTGIDEYCLVVPCDMPFLPVDLVERLHDALASHAAGYACTIHQVQPLVLLMRPHLLKTIPEYLQQGGRSVMGWLRSIDAIPVSFTPERGLADTGRVESKTGYDEAMDVPVGDNKLSMADGLRRNDFDNINDLASLSFLEKAF